jgi:hypothetical protein
MKYSRRLLSNEEDLPKFLKRLHRKRWRVLYHEPDGVGRGLEGRVGEIGGRERFRKTLANLARSSGDDNQNHVGRNQQASSKELPPMFPGWPQLKEPGHANDDEQEMGHAANQDQ